MKVAVHVEIPRGTENASDTRRVFSFECDKHSRSCEGFGLQLSGVDRGEPLKLVDTIHIHGARLLPGEPIYVVQWDEGRRFVVNVIGAEVRLEEQGKPPVTARCTTSS